MDGMQVLAAIQQAIAELNLALNAAGTPHDMAHVAAAAGLLNDVLASTAAPA